MLAYCKKYLVERKFVEKRINHLKLLELKKLLRRKDTDDKRIKRKSVKSNR